MLHIRSRILAYTPHTTTPQHAPYPASAAAKSGKPIALDAAGEKELFESHFVFACIWAFGGSVLSDKTADSRKEFSEWWKRTFQTIKFPKENTVFDYFPVCSFFSLCFSLFRSPTDGLMMTITMLQMI